MTTNPAVEIDLDKQRAEFEAWAATAAPKHSVERNANGEYIDYPTHCAWAGYRAAQARASQAVAEPVMYRCRIRPVWEGAGKGWSAWEECSRQSYEDYKRTPIYNDWEHEAQALYAAPVAQQSEAGGLDDLAAKISALTCAPHPAGYTAKEARMFNIGFYAGTSLSSEAVESFASQPVEAGAVLELPSLPDADGVLGHEGDGYGQEDWIEANCPAWSRYSVEKYTRDAIAADRITRNSEAGAHTAGAEELRATLSELAEARSKLIDVYAELGKYKTAGRESAASVFSEVRGCFEAAEAEGLSAALAETSDERLKDLVERRLMHALYAVQGVSEAGRESAAPLAQQDALEQLIAQHRIAITPEYEGGFRAEVYRDEEKPQESGYGQTPRAAVDAAMQKGAQ